MDAGKIAGVFCAKIVWIYLLMDQWLPDSFSDLKYISFIDDLTQLDSKVNDMLELNRLDCVFPKEEISQKFDPLRDTLIKCWK